ncbi:transporter [Lithospermum erythrorhizon]|uniref:Transporter n=1 Tax=Lithospermum erythrorhizon TaxID=34254 RepID=A0AAV3RCE3_LITER
MFFSCLLFFVGSKHYIKKIPDHSPIKTMTRVLVATIKKRRSKLLDRSCNIRQVEEVKCVIKLIPIWVACIIYFIVQVQMGTSSIVQALQSDRRVSQNSNFHIPAATYSVFSLLALLIWIPIYDQIIIPKARKTTKTEDGISMLQRLGVGFFLAIITMIISGLVENKRRVIAISQPTLGFAMSGGKISAMSCYWLVPQFAIAGISEGFSIIGQLEFYKKQLPENMRNFGLALLYCGFGLSTLLSTFVESIIHMITNNSKSGSWVAEDLNKGRLEYLYYLIAVLQLLNFVYFLVVAKRYKYIVVESKLLEVKTDAVNLSDHHTNALLPTQETTNLPTTMGSVEVETSRNEAERDEACLAKLSQQGEGSRQYYLQHIDDLQLHVLQQSDNLKCLQAQRDELRSKVRMLSEELQLLQEPGSYVGEVVKVIGKSKVLVNVHPEGKYVVDIDKSIDMTKITPSTRVALRNDSYVLHRILPSKVDPWSTS